MKKLIFYVRGIVLLLLMLLLSYYFILDYINVVEYTLLGIFIALCSIPKRVKKFMNDVLKTITIYYLEKEKANTNIWLNEAKSRDNEELSELQLYELRNIDEIAKDNIGTFEKCLNILDKYKFYEDHMSEKVTLNLEKNN